MKRIPNILSISRAVVALLIPLAGKHSGWFLATIAFCGLTDVLDGYLARKWNCESDLGSKLDSLGDWIMGLAIAAYLLIWKMDIIYCFVPFIIAIIGVRLLSLLVCYLRNKKLYTIHTWLNKFTGVLVFAGICLIPLFNSHPEMVFVFSFALLSALEDLMIFILVRNPNPDLKSIFNLT